MAGDAKIGYIDIAITPQCVYGIFIYLFIYYINRIQSSTETREKREKDAEIWYVGVLWIRQFVGWCTPRN